MNKNGQHSYQFLNDFPLWYNYKNRPWTLKKLARHAMKRAFKAKNLARPPSWIKGALLLREGGYRKGGEGGEGRKAGKGKKRRGG